jgi:hypothetical protein
MWSKKTAKEFAGNRKGHRNTTGRGRHRYSIDDIAKVAKRSRYAVVAYGIRHKCDWFNLRTVIDYVNQCNDKDAKKELTPSPLASSEQD